MKSVFFVLFSFVAVISSLLVVAQRNPVHVLFYFVIMVLSFAIMYLCLGAELIAVFQVLIYAGAITVVFLFMIMFVKSDSEMKFLTEKKSTIMFGIAFAVSILILLSGGIYYLAFSNVRNFSVCNPHLSRNVYESITRNLEGLSSLLVSEYAVQFEMATLVVLIAIIGVIYMTDKRREERERNKNGEVDRILN